ncbi:MAG: outer membrane protein assembly factor BamA [Planctomycetota bacterium]|jgi:outer membrane protein insertion porin family|nr:outer membrane protein assembly factor BamA [Planctomycetota bacterium]
MSMKPGWGFIPLVLAATVAWSGATSAGEAFFEDDDYLEEAPAAPAPAPAAPAAGSDRVNVGGPEAEGVMVTEIEVLNAVTTTPEQIIYRMSTRVGYPLNERVLDGDFQRLTGMGLFDDVQIKKEMAGAGVKITVVVREKDVIRRIEFTGNQQIKSRKLSSLIESKVGERFDAGKGNRDRRAIEDYLNKEFYYFGEVATEVEPFEDGVLLTFNVTEGGRLYVADILFRGNTVFSRKALLGKMETKRSGLMSRGKYLRRNFERDLERIRMSYLDKGYLDVKVTERPFEITANTPTSRWQRRDVYLHIDIEEGEQYRVGRVDFDFAGTSLVSEEKIRGVIKTMPGAVYSPITLQEDAAKIREIYGQAPNSRYFTRVLPDPQITEDGLVMDVTLRIQESPEIMIEGVRVTGLTHTKEVVVLREFELFPGEKIDSRKFNRSKENIENLGYFKERPNIEIREGSAPDRAIMVAELEETSTGKITAGVGVSSQDSVVGSFGISQRNFDYRDRPKTLRDLYTGKSFRGAGQSFAINVSAGAQSQNHSVSFTNPWIFGKPISMTASLFYSSYKYENDDYDNSDYHETRYGASLVFGKRLFDVKELTVSGGYRLELVKMSNFDAQYSEEFTRQQGSHNLSRWLAGINYDSRDSVFEPTRGFQAGLNLELAGTAAGSSKDFWRGLFSSQYFIPFFTDSQDRNWSIGFRGDFSLAQAYGRGDGEGREDDVPFYERFHAGGVGSLRGYDFRGVSPRDFYGNAMGGEAAATASVEIFFPIWERLIRGSLFYDVGTAWRYLDDPGAKNKTDARGLPIYTTDRKFRSSGGVGLHVKTPLGPMPVRLYYAFPMGKRDHDETQRFQFTMGALF